MNEYDFVSEDDPRMGILYDIQTYADRNPGYNPKFVDSIEENLKKFGQITIKQFEVLKKIHKELNLNIEEDL